MTQAALLERVDRLVAAWNAIHAKRPRLLYHYTDAPGLLGMMETQRLWATNTRFMNDPTEVAYAVAIVRHSVEDLGKRYPQPLVKDVAGAINTLLDAYDKVDDKYIACFCERGDLLSQWRGYGADGGGYSVGFLARHLGLTSYQTLKRPEPVLRKVVYDQKAQRHAIDRWVNAIFEWESLHRRRAGRARVPLNLDDEAWSSLNWFLSECLYCFKDPAYREEREWRVAQYGRNVFGERPVSTKFRPSRGRIVQFVELDVTIAAGKQKGKLPIKVIRYGPTLDPIATERALRLLLEVKGYTKMATKVARSDVPFSG